MPLLETERLERYDSLYLTARADDAALSCPGRILSEKARGLRILVLALFEPAGEGGPAPEAPPGLARLDVDWAFAGLASAARRRPSETSFRALAFGREPEDDEWLRRAARLLGDVAPRVRPRHVYAPLGVGGHIDHRMVHEAARQAFADEPGRNMFFYEERPEAFVPGAVRTRLGLLGARLPPGAAEAAENAGLARYLLRFPLAPALRGEFRGWTDRLRTTRAAAREWREARGWNPQKSFGPRLQPILHEADSERMAVVREVLAAVLPPNGTRLRSTDRLVALISAYARRLGRSGYAERYWLLLPSLGGADQPQLPTAVGE